MERKTSGNFYFFYFSGFSYSIIMSDLLFVHNLKWVLYGNSFPYKFKFSNFITSLRPVWALLLFYIFLKLFTLMPVQESFYSDFMILCILNFVVPFFCVIRIFERGGEWVFEIKQFDMFQAVWETSCIIFIPFRASSNVWHSSSCFPLEPSRPICLYSKIWSVGCSRFIYHALAFVISYFFFFMYRFTTLLWKET